MNGGGTRRDRKRAGIMGMPAVAGLVLLVLLTGCQSRNRVASATTSEVCPTCKVETRIQPITGQTYTRGLCPSCQRVSTLDETTLANVERYVGGHVGDTAHVCDRCGSVVETCSVCRAAQ